MELSRTGQKYNLTEKAWLAAFPGMHCWKLHVAAAVLDAGQVKALKRGGYDERQPEGAVRIFSKPGTGAFGSWDYGDRQAEWSFLEAWSHGLPG